MRTRESASPPLKTGWYDYFPYLSWPLAMEFIKQNILMCFLVEKGKIITCVLIYFV